MSGTSPPPAAEAACFRALLQDPETALAVEGLDGAWLHVSDALCRLTARPPAALLGGGGLRDLVHPDDRAAEREQQRRVAGGGAERCARELRLLRPGGAPLGVRLTRLLVRDGAGRPLRVLARVEDLSERDRAAAELHTLQEQLTRVVETQQAIAAAGLELDRVLELALRRACELTAAGGAVVELVVDGDTLVYRAGTGGMEAYTGLRLPMEGSLSGLCVRSGAVLRCDDAEADPRVDTALCRRVGLRSMVVAPLRHHGRPVGVIKVMSERPLAFGRRDEATLELLAAPVAASVHHAAEFQARQVLVEERTRTLEALARSEARFRVLAENTSDLVCLHDSDGRYLYVSPSVRRLLAYAPDELVGTDPYAIVHPDDRERVRRESHEQALRGEESVRVRYRMRRGTGEYRWLETFTQPIAPGEGAGAMRLLTTSRDVTAAVEAEHALRAREARFRAATAGMRDGFVVLRALQGPGGTVEDFHVVEMNRSARALLGLPPSELPEPGLTLRGMIPSAVHSGLVETARRVLRTGQRYDGEHRAREPRTAVDWVRLQVFPLEPEEGALAVIVRDISDRKQAEARLREEANRDPLTGLLNRRGFEQVVEPRVAAAAAAGRPDVLLYLDLDDFKGINDRHGHGEGDAALQCTARLLQAALRTGDAVARFGGDEFVVHAPAGAEAQRGHDAALLKARVVAALAEDSEHQCVAGRPYALSASIGAITLQPGETLEAALARADRELYLEKRPRRGPAAGSAAGAATATA